MTASNAINLFRWKSNQIGVVARNLMGFAETKGRKISSSSSKFCSFFLMMTTSDRSKIRLDLIAFPCSVESNDREWTKVRMNWGYLPFSSISGLRSGLVKPGCTFSSNPFQLQQPFSYPILEENGSAFFTAGTQRLEMFIASLSSINY